jgi:hypothetical protein
MTAPIASGWSDCRVGLAPTGKRRLCTAHARSSLSHSRFVPDAHGAQSACDDAAIDPVSIADEVVRSLIPEKRRRYLTCNPFCRRICSDVGPEVSAAEPDDDEGIEQVETDSWNNEQVMEAMSGAWLRKKVRHPWLGGPRPLTMYLATLDCAITCRTDLAPRLPVERQPCCCRSAVAPLGATAL